MIISSAALEAFANPTAREQARTATMSTSFGTAAASAQHRPITGSAQRPSGIAAVYKMTG
jgi:hypothetical protein